MKPTAAFGYDILRRLGRSREPFETISPDDDEEADNDPDSSECE